MPNYMTHSVHGEKVLEEIDKRIELNINDFKTFCIGFDTFILTDYSLFKRQHREKTKDYFEALLKEIKKRNLQDNSETISFLYGELDHFILDIIIHPLIYYMTKALKKEHLMDYHSLVETWIDDYVIQKYGDIEPHYYHKWRIKDKELKTLIREVYKNIYNESNMIFKYDVGISSVNIYDYLARRNRALIAPLICKAVNLGDILYRKDIERIKPFLNLNHEIWYNPETEEELTESFDDLWAKAIEEAKEAIYDVNRFLYDDKPLTTRIIKDNLSANTGLPCDIPQTLKKVKRY